jgi:hypothetical protein
MHASLPLLPTYRAAQVRKPDGSLSECQHCFPVYGGGLEVKGVEGILQVRASMCVCAGAGLPSAVFCIHQYPFCSLVLVLQRSVI